MNLATKLMLAMYEEQRVPAPSFLSDMFRMTPRSVHRSEKVTFDVMRHGEKMAPVVKSVDSGYVAISLDKAVNKEITPPVVKMKFPINLMDTQQRELGQSPFEQPNELRNATQRFTNGMMELSTQVTRLMEFQAAQLFQTGKLTLIDEDGDQSFGLDFLPKAALYPTAATAWSDPTVKWSDKKSLINQTAKEIRKASGARADALIFGEKAFENIANDPDFIKEFDARNINTGALTPRMSMDSGTFQGFITINNYRYEMWTYDGMYEDHDGAYQEYIDPVKIVVLATNARREKTFGMIPKVVADDPRLRGFISGAVKLDGFAATTGAVIDMDNENIHGKLATRPLLIPVAIDTHGCINTAIS